MRVANSKGMPPAAKMPSTARGSGEVENTYVLTMRWLCHSRGGQSDDIFGQLR
jgi:hypothetical protein